MERHRDPLELWVGTWTPEELKEKERRKVLEREKIEKRAPEMDTGKTD